MASITANPRGSCMGVLDSIKGKRKRPQLKSKLNIKHLSKSNLREMFSNTLCIYSVNG